MKDDRPTFAELRERGVLEYGDGYRAKNEELGGNGPIFLRAAYLQDAGFVLNNPDRFKAISQSSYETKASRLGDVVITTKGNSTGRIGVIRDREAGAIYSPHLSYWRSVDREILDQNFLFYWSQGPEFATQLKGMAHSTDMAPYLSLRDQGFLRITLPLISNQIETGAILRALDDKIELNRRMNETLEAMARAIFRDWFVDFGPTRAKMEGRAPYLVPDLWSLFPDTINETTGLPDGWTEEPLHDQAHWINGAAYKNMDFSDEPDALPVVKIAELKNGITPQTKHTNTALGEKYRIGDGELLFSWSGNPDTSIDAFVWTRGAAWLNQHIFAVRLNGRRSTASLYVMLKAYMPQFAEIARNKQTTGLGHVTKEDMKRLMVPAAPHEVTRAFEATIEPLFRRLVANLFEIQTLTETRDYLLPKLMSGEVHVRGAAAAIEQVA